MTTATVRDGRRLAKPLQAVYLAVRSGRGHADTLQVFHAALEDEHSMSPGCYDPDHYQGWAWWAERMLGAAGEQPERPLQAREQPEPHSDALPGFLLGLTTGCVYGALLVWLW